MKTLISAALLLATSVASATSTQALFEQNGVDYIWRGSSVGAVVTVFKDANPMELCELADANSGEVHSIYNVTTNIRAYCAVPAK